MARSNRPAPDAETVTFILQLTTYLSANPKACDSPEGIARWWLADVVADAAGRASLQAALDLLEGAALLERLSATDGRARYRRVDALADFAARVQDLIAGAGGAGAGAGGQVH